MLLRPTRMWELSSRGVTGASSWAGRVAPPLSSLRLALLLRFPFEGVTWVVRSWPMGERKLGEISL